MNFSAYPRILKMILKEIKSLLRLLLTSLLQAIPQILITKLHHMTGNAKITELIAILLKTAFFVVLNQ